MKKIALTIAFIMTASVNSHAMEYHDDLLWCGNTGFEISDPNIVNDLCLQLDSEEKFCQKFADRNADLEEEVEDLKRKLAEATSATEIQTKKFIKVRNRLRSLKARK